MFKRPDPLRPLGEHRDNVVPQIKLRPGKENDVNSDLKKFAPAQQAQYFPKTTNFNTNVVTSVQPARPAATTTKTPRKKEKLSSLCKTPPSLIKSRAGLNFARGSCLGEGGFARCFQVKDDAGKTFAAKTVAKESVRNEKTKNKLLAEIKIHKSLRHPNIVEFVDCFEDDHNVYILLEMCSNQSMMEMLRARKTFTEGEAKYYMTQILGAINFMHRRRVIHRDLKLGNIFLDSHMHVKIGDFGLATVLDKSSDRRVTICGTPNYIAPEVLAGKHKGHSFEVDIWSAGVILYTMVVGRPPFQSKDVETIYQRIKKNDWEFPGHVPVSAECKDLVRKMLVGDPQKRIDLAEILSHPFFYTDFPASIHPEAAKKRQPETRVSYTQSCHNFDTLKIAARLDARSLAPRSTSPVVIERQDVEAEQPTKILPQSLSPASTKEKYKMVNVKQDDMRRLVNKMPIAQGGVEADQRVMENVPQTMQLKPQAQLYQIYGEALARRLQHMPLRAAPLTKHGKTIFISKWVDYSNRFGFAYQLSSNVVGVLMEQENTILMDMRYEEHLFQVVVEQGRGDLAAKSNWSIDNFTQASYPSEHKHKMKLVKQFHKFMNEHLIMVEDDNEVGLDLVWVLSWRRSPGFVVFHLSNDSFQFNFEDHCKMVLSHCGQTVMFIDDHKNFHNWSLDEVFMNAHDGHWNLEEKLVRVYKYFEEQLK